MHPEQFDKIRTFLFEHNQQELVGHLDGFKQEYDKLKASEPAQPDATPEPDTTTPLTEGQPPAPNGFPTGPAHDAQTGKLDDGSDEHDENDEPHEPNTPESSQAFQDDAKQADESGTPPSKAK